jgi:hypothetical protein
MPKPRSICIGNTRPLPAALHLCGRHLLAAKLRRSNIDASAGAVEEVARIVAQIRRRWPRTRIRLRGDSGFAHETLMAWCEANRVDVLFGLARNERLEAAIKDELMLASLDSLCFLLLVSGDDRLAPKSASERRPAPAREAAQRMMQLSSLRPLA